MEQQFHQHILIHFVEIIEFVRYYLSVFFYKTVLEVTTLTFNELLSVVLLEDINDWKDLVYALCENLSLQCDISENPHEEDYVTIEGMKLHFSGFINQITINDIEIKLPDHEYTTVVEAMFKCVEYVANILDVADNMFVVEEPEDNVMEGEMGEDEMGGEEAGDEGGAEEEGGDAGNIDDEMMGDVQPESTETTQV